jgi:curved DNA-binding protein CbpA
MQARGIDFSNTGAKIECDRPIDVKSSVYIRADEYGLMGSASVRHCSTRGSKYVLGLGLDGTCKDRLFGRKTAFDDFYEFMQISPNADAVTIHRVFRMLAARYHPDNSETGDPEKFMRLTRMYEVLADPARRAVYDVEFQMHRPERVPIFELKEFVEGIDAESNRRMGVLCLLYKRRKCNPDYAGWSLLQLESLMAFPREHLLFTLWYLKEKGLVRVAQNSDYEITAAGLDYVESGVKANGIFLHLLEPPKTDAAGQTIREQAQSVVPQTEMRECRANGRAA